MMDAVKDWMQSVTRDDWQGTVDKINRLANVARSDRDKMKLNSMEISNILSDERQHVAKYSEYKDKAGNKNESEYMLTIIYSYIEKPLYFTCGYLQLMDKLNKYLDRFAAGKSEKDGFFDYLCDAFRGGRKKTKSPQKKADDIIRALHDPEKSSLSKDTKAIHAKIWEYCETAGNASDNKECQMFLERLIKEQDSEGLAELSGILGLKRKETVVEHIKSYIEHWLTSQASLNDTISEGDGNITIGDTIEDASVNVEKEAIEKASLGSDSFGPELFERIFTDNCEKNKSRDRGKLLVTRTVVRELTYSSAYGIKLKDWKRFFLKNYLAARSVMIKNEENEKNKEHMLRQKQTEISEAEKEWSGATKREMPPAFPPVKAEIDLLKGFSLTPAIFFQPSACEMFAKGMIFNYSELKKSGDTCGLDIGARALKDSEIDWFYQVSMREILKM